MTGEQKIQFIRDQCNAIWESRQEVAVDCPYCLRSVKPGEGPCCIYMDKVIRLLLEQEKRITEGMKCYERREFGRMIMDKNGN